MRQREDEIRQQVRLTHEATRQAAGEADWDLLLIAYEHGADYNQIHDHQRTNRV